MRCISRRAFFVRLLTTASTSTQALSRLFAVRFARQKSRQYLRELSKCSTDAFGAEEKEMNIQLNENFHRVLISSPNLLTKKYNYKDIFQILPPNKNWYKKDFVQNRYPLILEFNSSFQREYDYKKEVNEKKADTFDIYAEFNTSTFNFKKELIYLLTVFSFCFFNEKIVIGKHNRLWYGKRYFVTDFQKRNIQQVAKDDVYKCFDENKLMGYEIKFPIIIEDLLDQYFVFTGELLDVTRRAIILFYKSFEIARYSYSMSLVSMISAIEAIIRFENRNIENEICKTCNQVKSLLSKIISSYELQLQMTDIRIMNRRWLQRT